MNIAVIIAVRDYNGSANNLPACANDGKLMKTILDLSTKYDDILCIDTDTQSSRVKTALSQFIEKHKKSGIKEAFFYYTGHGEALTANDFHFLFSDFDPNKKQQTSLTNEELDAMLRSLSPELMVKVVDACQSGVAYIKDKDALAKALEVSKAGFKKCYFMFSSQRDQASFQDSKLSAFSAAFAQSIATHTEPSIRYKDIADFVSDAFANDSQQNPTFVVQADLTEVFCNITEQVRGALQKLFPGSAPPSDIAKIEAPPDELLTVVQKDAERYCNKDQAMASIMSFVNEAQNYTPPEQLSELYGVKAMLLKDYDDVPNLLAIATWLKDNKHEYFAKLTYRDEEYEAEIDVPKRRYSLFHPEVEFTTRTVTKNRRVLVGIELTADCPVKAIKLEFTPKYENLPWWRVYIVLVFSKVNVRLFYAFPRVKERNWSERVAVGDVAWKTQEVGLRSDSGITKAFQNIVGDLNQTMIGALRERFGLSIAAARPDSPEGTNRASAC